MTMCRDPRLERLSFFDGARLLAPDLCDSLGYVARLQALQVRGLHQTWGVASGLRLDPAGGGRSVLVKAGVAFDCRGDVVVLHEDVESPVPALLVPGVAEPAFDVLLNRRGVRWEATGFGASSPAFGSRVHIGEDIPLGRYIRRLNGTVGSPDYSVRRAVRPMARPSISFGITAPGELSWSTSSSFVRTIVDTSAANFSTTPYYAVQLVAVPALNPDLVGPFFSIAWSYPNRFSARLHAYSRAGQNMLTVLRDLMVIADSIRIAWVGFEPNLGCSAGAPGGFV